MWIEKTKTGYKYCERYLDPMTEKTKKVSVTLQNNDRKSKKLAAEQLDQIISERIRLSDGSNLTFSELVDKYLASSKKNVRLSTFRRNKIVAEWWCDLLGDDTLIKKISAGYISDKLDTVKKSNHYKNERLTRLKPILRWAYRKDYLESVEYLNKLEPYPENTAKEKLEDKFLEANEVTILLDALSRSRAIYWYDLTRFLLLSGLRIGEALALQKSDFNDDYIYIHRTYDTNNDILCDVPKTDASNRKVYIQPELKELLTCIKVHNKRGKITSTYLFYDRDGNVAHYDAFRSHLIKYSKKYLNREITPHVLRHTHASMLFAKGVDIETVSRRLGHENSKITREIYIHYMEELEQKQAQELAKIRII